MKVNVSINPRNFSGRKPPIDGLIGLGTQIDDPSIAFELDIPES